MEFRMVTRAVEEVLEYRTRHVVDNDWANSVWGEWKLYPPSEAAPEDEA